jgi:hypothetical protein
MSSLCHQASATSECPGFLRITIFISELTDSQYGAAKVSRRWKQFLFASARFIGLADARIAGTDSNRSGVSLIDD